MESLVGFRAPHFSEDEAWLPAYLQQPEDNKPFNQTFDEEKSLFEKRIQELLLLRGNTSEESNAPCFSNKEGGYKCCQLFLSADSSTPFSFASSSWTENAVHFHLHLSTNDSLENMSITEGTLQNDGTEFERSLEASVAPQGDNNRSDAEHDTSTPLALSITSSMRSADKDRHERHEEFEISKGEDISNSIELSVAASEATVIHEVIQSMSFPEHLSSSAVLEVALQLKHARLESCKEAFDFQTELFSECGSLSDLDDEAMRDAYLDVGFDDETTGGSCNNAGASTVKSGNTDNLVYNISHLKLSTTPDDERHCKNDRYSNIIIPESDYSTSDMDFMNEKVKDSLENDIHAKHLELKSSERENMLKDVREITNDANNVPCHNELKGVYQLQQNSVSTSIGVEANNFPAKQVDKFQLPKVSPPAYCPTSTGHEHEGTDDRYWSRWYGGWTWKEEKSSAPAIFDHKSIPKPFTHETSFLSESADAAPDECSAVQKQDNDKTLASQSSTPSVNHNKANNVTLLSQEITKSPTRSLIDPLCSFVPCSISSENGCVISSVNNDGEVFTRGFQEHRTENDMLNAQTTCDLDDVLRAQELVIPDSLEGMQPAVSRREFTSLRSFSRLLPPQVQFLEKETDSDEYPPEHMLGMQATGAQLRDEQKCGKTPKYHAELAVDMQKKNTFPIILNCGTRRLQASNIDIDGVPNHFSTPEQFPACQNFHEEQSNHKRQMVIPFPAKKRVRFSETAIVHKETFKEKQPLTGSCHNNKANKNVKRRDILSVSKTLERLGHLKHHPVKSKGQLFQNMEFLLSGFSSKKQKEIEKLIKLTGGTVLSDIPSPPTSRTKRNSRSRTKALPIVICLKKQQTIRFLYGCAVNAFMLKVSWLTDSISAGSLLPPQRYLILPKTISKIYSGFPKPAHVDCHSLIFHGVGFMLLGKNSFCSTIEKVIKHGGGHVIRTLQHLVQSVDSGKISTGILVSEDESRISRHLRQCALEQSIHVLPMSWITRSLHQGKLLPFKTTKDPAPLLLVNPLDCADPDEMSMEI